MGLDLFVCSICNDSYTEYEQKYCHCGGYVCEHCTDKYEDFMDEDGHTKWCGNCIDKRDIVLISQSHYDELMDASNFLECLVACGVDNWEGYDYACEMMRNEEE